MCEPVSIAMSVGSALASVAGTLASASSMAKAAERQSYAAMEANALNQSALRNRQQELADKEQLDSFERMRQSLRDEAKIMTSAAEGGVVGGSILAALHENELGAAYDINIINKSSATNVRQTNLEGIRYRNQAQTLINEAQSRVPSGLTAGLNIAGSALSGAATGYSISQSASGLFKGSDATYIPHRKDGLH